MNGTFSEYVARTHSVLPSDPLFLKPSDFPDLLGKPCVALTRAHPREVIDRMPPDVTPIPEGFPSSDAASVLCAVRPLVYPTLSNLRTDFTDLGRYRLPCHQVLPDRTWRLDCYSRCWWGTWTSCCSICRRQRPPCYRDRWVMSPASSVLSSTSGTDFAHWFSFMIRFWGR